MTERLDKMNKQYNGIGSRPKLESRHKCTQDPINIKMKQVARTKWDVYNTFRQRAVT